VKSSEALKMNGSALKLLLKNNCEGTPVKASDEKIIEVHNAIFLDHLVSVGTEAKGYFDINIPIPQLLTSQLV
jgi:hypothetical protein